MLSASGGCAALVRLFLVRQPTIARSIMVLLLFCVLSLVGLSYYVSTGRLNAKASSSSPPPSPIVGCMSRADDDVDVDGRRSSTSWSSSSSSAAAAAATINDHGSMPPLRTVGKVLVLVETPFTKMGQEIVAILEASRVRYKTEMAQKRLPNLAHMDRGRYGVVVFERLESYLNMDTWNRQLLDKYCRQYGVGVVAFARPDDRLFNAQVRDFPLFVHSKLSMRDYRLWPGSPVPRLVRVGQVARGVMPGDDWTVFVPNHTTYEPIACAKLSPTRPFVFGDDVGDLADILHTTIVRDRGQFDGIRRVLFGNSFKFWLHRPLFLDALSYLSHGKLSVPLERYLLIDIDDIFVSKEGTRMKPDDVQALLESQTRLQKRVEGFRFNLGFSGKYFHHGSEAENAGDDMLIENREYFWWFDHTWSHMQSHQYNVTEIVHDMTLNKEFAKKHGIVANNSYAVAPHHAGVYPVHEPLYEAWKKVWKIKVTSTEEYPHLKPARYRRGFVYRGIKVLPRQTCGLFTHTIFMDKFPGGQAKLDKSIRGGELFLTILFNPVSIFMTHLSNYGSDRLGLYTFESVIKFIQCWTNLKLKTVEPLKLASIYFDMFPNEVDPVWRNPCNDKRHMAIWSPNKSCRKLPHFLVIGPQKTGTTALHAFLKMHPLLVSNYRSLTTYEEVQFFKGKNYNKGLDWYMTFFPDPGEDSNVILFEKSANYFDSEVVPGRAYALLPNAKLICIIIDPAKRAYSWYQHQRAHQDATALSYTFHEVVTAGDNASKELLDLRYRCLNPGQYAYHLENWLDHYNDEQMLIIDGEKLRLNPILVMDEVQRFLQVDPIIDYSTKLKYNPKKGFFCQVTGANHTKCLGREKGRLYPEMDPQSELYLAQYYRKHNIALSKLLTSMGRPVPHWLEEQLTDQR